jgi:hypothetical protein
MRTFSKQTQQNNMTIKQLKRGRKSYSITIAPEILQKWEDLRTENDLAVSKLPVSQPTYRKAIVTGQCAKEIYNILTVFFNQL